MGRSISSGRPNLVVTVAFAVTIVLLYLPLFCVAFQIFLTDPNDWSSPWTMRWLMRLFESGAFWAPLLTSVEIGVASATIALALGTAGAVGLGSGALKMGSVLQSLIVLPILVPEVITGLSLLLLFLMMGVPLGFWTVTLAHASFSASFVYFIMREQLRKLDPQLSEAAQDLGARPDEVFWQVTVPNILPGAAGGWLLAFTLSFDDFLISFFTSGAGLTTLPLKIYSLMRLGISPELNGLSFLMISLSSLLVLILLSREQSRRWVFRR